MTSAPAAREPKHERGHARVAAILRSASAVFGEKGYDAATMTEIAARSDTAVASLYHFFPSKEVIADTLLLDYARRALGDLDNLRSRAGELTAPELADALVDYALALRSHRRLVLGLIEVRAGARDKQAAFGRDMVEGLSALLRAAIPHLPRAGSRTTAAVVLHVLKGVAAADGELPAARRALVAQWRTLLSSHLTAAAAPAGPAGGGPAPRRPRRSGG